MWGSFEKYPRVSGHVLQTARIRADQDDLMHGEDLANLGQADCVSCRLRHQLHRGLAVAGSPPLLSHIIPNAQTVSHPHEVGAGRGDLGIGMVDFSCS